MISRNSSSKNSNKKIETLLNEFDLLCKEEKRDFMMKLWERYCSEIMDDIFIKEIMMKMCNDMMKGGPMPAFMESFFKNK
jgi:hypothetical protein